MYNPINWLIVIGIIILLWFLFSWYEATIECSKNTKEIIENQKKIIELLSKDNNEK